jgi:hypothetical protein
MFFKVSVKFGIYLQTNTISSFNICLTGIKTLRLVKFTFLMQSCQKEIRDPNQNC